MTSILDLFQIEKVPHLEAYWHLAHSGKWPDGFWADSVTFPPGWRETLDRRLALRFVTAKLGEFAFTQSGLSSVAFELMEDLIDVAKNEQLHEDIKRAEEDSMSCAEWVEACRKQFERVFPSISHFRVTTSAKRLVVLVQPSTWGVAMAYDPEKAVKILKRFPDGHASDGDSNGDRDFQVEKALEAALVEIGL